LLADIVVLLFQLFVTLFALFFLLRDADTIMQECDARCLSRLASRTHDSTDARPACASIAAGLVIPTARIRRRSRLRSSRTWCPSVLGCDDGVPGTVAVRRDLGRLVTCGDLAVGDRSLVKGAILGVLGVTIVGSIDNFLRPAILSGRTQMNGLLMFISLLGGVSVFGLLGLVLGPLVTAIVSGLFEVYVGPSDTIGTARTNEDPKQ
jgi:hypothetical protein